MSEVSPQNSSVTSMLKIVTQKLSVNAVSEKGAFLLIRTQNIQKKKHFLSPDTSTYVWKIGVRTK